MPGAENPAAKAGAAEGAGSDRTLEALRRDEVAAARRLVRTAASGMLDAAASGSDRVSDFFGVLRRNAKLLDDEISIDPVVEGLRGLGGGQTLEEIEGRAITIIGGVKAARMFKGVLDGDDRTAIKGVADFGTYASTHGGASVANDYRWMVDALVDGDAGKIPVAKARAARTKAVVPHAGDDTVSLSRIILSVGISPDHTFYKLRENLISDPRVKPHLIKKGKDRFAVPVDMRDALRGYLKEYKSGKAPPENDTAGGSAEAISAEDSAAVLGKYPLDDLMGFLAGDGASTDDVATWLAGKCADVIGEYPEGEALPDDAVREIVSMYDGSHRRGQQGYLTLAQAVSEVKGDMVFKDAMTVAKMYEAELMEKHGEKAVIRESDLWKLRLVLSTDRKGKGDALVPLGEIYREFRVRDGEAATDYLMGNPMTNTRLVEREGTLFVRAGDLGMIGHAMYVWKP